MKEGDSDLLSSILSKLDKNVEGASVSKVSTSQERNKATFAAGETTETELTPLTPYWDDHMWKLDIHIPLTIFDEDWLSRDLMVAVKKASKTKDRPTGQLPKSEWWMTYSDWTRSTCLFIAYLKEVYHHTKFADALEKHFAYVLKLDARHGWVTAFRYDIAVRSNVMCHRVRGSVADPSVRRALFLESAIAKTDSFKDGWVRRHDNRMSFFSHSFETCLQIPKTELPLPRFPKSLAYVKGGERERFNPLSGAKYERLETHDANKQEEVATTSTSRSVTREGYQPKRGRPKFFNKEERSKWKGKGRENSPYHRNVSENSVKTVEVNSKTKEKQ